MEKLTIEEVKSLSIRDQINYIYDLWKSYPSDFSGILTNFKPILEALAHVNGENPRIGNSDEHFKNIIIKGVLKHELIKPLLIKEERENKLNDLLDCI